MRTTLRRIGNSQGFVVPKPLVAQLGFDGQVDMTIEGDALVFRKPADAVRVGWAEAASDIAAHEDDLLVMGEFANAADDDLTW